MLKDNIEQIKIKKLKNIISHIEKVGKLFNKTIKEIIKYFN